MLLLVGVTAQDKAISSVTWSGTAMTQHTIGTRNSMRVALYYIALGTFTANKVSSVVVTFAANTDAFVGAADYTGVYQPTPFVNPTVTQNKSTKPSITFTSATGHKAVGLLGDISATPTGNGSGQTQYWTFTGSHSNRATEKAGAASVTLSHTLSANEDWVMIGGTMQDNAVILPVEIVDFKANRLPDNFVLLSWNTATEKQNSHFIIQRSLDGSNWDEIVQVKGAGTTSSPNDYKYEDDLSTSEHSPALEAKSIYYRLIQVDMDGTMNEYRTIEASPVKESEIEMIVYPNPVENGRINLHVDMSRNEDTALLQILNDLGKVVFELPVALKKGDNDLHLQCVLTAGVYLARVTAGNHTLHTERFVTH